MKYTDQQIVKLVVNFMQRICMDQYKKLFDYLHHTGIS